MADAYFQRQRPLSSVEGQFDRRSSVKTWLYRIATNTSLDALRSRKSRQAVLDVAVGEAGVENAEARLALSELAGWLSVLPDEQRVAIILSAVEGLSSAEIGEVLGCSEGAVEQRLVRARATLRRKRGDG